MEDLEMTQALRRYVEAGEPPFSLTASALISQARRRHRWRVGLGIGGGGAATTLTILSAMALVPAGGSPTLGPQGCDVQLPLGIWSTPTVPPDFPSKPTDFPGPAPSGHPTPTRDSASGMTPLPGGAGALPTPPPWMEPGVDKVARAVDTSRLDQMSCFLKRRLLQLRPRASFAPHIGAPMEVKWSTGTAADNTRVSVYEASAYVIDGPLLCLIQVVVFPGDPGLSSGIGHSEHQAVATYKTASSTIVVSVEGGVITDADAMAIAKAPELDVFR